MKIRVDPWPVQPTKVAVFTGIICNLACTLCGPEASSLWRSELSAGKYTGNDIEVADYDFSKVDYVTFGGGEPLLNKSSLEIFKVLNNDTSIQFHSNGTLLPSQEYLDQFARFNDFVLVFSIDDIEEQFELLRWPAKWNEVAENILWYKEHCPPNVRFAFNTVVSLLNEPTHTRVQDWVQQNIPVNKSGVQTSWFTNETNGLLNRIKTTDARNPMTFLDNLDKRRGTSWRKTFPIYAADVS
jgi:sulfatase maturation enzyme AslB (radical SAM superfamily)